MKCHSKGMKHHSVGIKRHSRGVFSNDRYTVVAGALAGTLTVMLGAALCIGTFYTWKHRFYPESMSAWPSVVGQVIGERITVVGTFDRMYQPGAILYQEEADVSYTRDGVHTTQWFPVGSVDSNRAYVKFWLDSHKSRQCILHWNPKNFKDVVVTLH